MTPYQREELENVGRQARKAKTILEGPVIKDSEIDRLLDITISILDQVERIKKNEKAQDSASGH